MPLGDWFSANPQVEQTHASTRKHKPLDFSRFHQEAQDEARTIKKERKDVDTLNMHINEIVKDVKQKIDNITIDMDEKIRTMSEERDLEVKGLKAEVAKLENHIQHAHGLEIVTEMTAPVKEKYAVKLNM